MTTKYSICNKNYQVTLTDLFKFELRSLYGRIILKSQPKLQKNCKNLLNLGCGTTYFQGWVNA
ncbi:hypothetical protein CEN44_16520, partial [Fischerella muscicola CCMEE 5323]